MSKEILFYLVILLSNIIQGITGFAGTILAMPFSLKLVGMGVAVPVLNLLGLLSGIYVFAGNRDKVDKKVLKTVVIIMGISLILGIVIKQLLSGKPQLLYMILGTIVLAISISGLIKTLINHLNRNGKQGQAAQTDTSAEITGSVPFAKKVLMNALLVAAGVVHGMFVCGGPLLISYMTRKLPEKSAFRATISTVWIFLNGMLFVSHIIGGQWTPDTIRCGIISIPFLLGGMFIGGKLYSRMSQHFFVLLTYILLFLSGLSLFFK